jgi:hypothetical protein
VIWSDESSYTLYPTTGRGYVWRTPKEFLIGTVKHGEGSVMVWAAISIMVQHSVGPIITLHIRISAREYVNRLSNQVHPMIQTLFPNNHEVLQDNRIPIHKPGTVQS